MPAFSRDDLSPEQIENLDKLGTYLEKLPENYDQFDMANFITDVDDESEVIFDYGQYINYALYNGGVPCGTVACALGHGPAAGVLASEEHIRDGGINWSSYSRNFVNPCTDVWYFLFSGGWSLVDNTPHGAAARIRYVLDGNPAPMLGIGVFDHAASLKRAKELYAKYLKGEVENATA